MKDFILICNKNCVATNEVFPLLKRDLASFGYTKPDFDGLTGLCRWITTLPTPGARKPLILTKTYNPEDYPKYDNYDAIEVSKIKDIPYDYDGVMGVPIGIFDWDTTYEVLGQMKGEYCQLNEDILSLRGTINGKNKYTRVLIKRKNYEN